MSIMFHQICINEEMLAKYIYFKLHNPAAHKYYRTLEYRRTNAHSYKVHTKVTLLL